MPLDALLGALMSVSAIAGAALLRGIQMLMTFIGGIRITYEPI